MKLSLWVVQSTPVVGAVHPDAKAANGRGVGVMRSKSQDKAGAALYALGVADAAAVVVYQLPNER